MAAKNPRAWKRQPDGRRELLCEICNGQQFSLSWEPMERQRTVQTAHHRRIVATCQCGWKTRVCLGGVS
jgi:hypothetical protein